eukprot:scaffold25473_cov53-Cyclotella_meneghiniana.AAC.1
MKQQGSERLPERGSLSDGEVEEAKKEDEPVTRSDTTTEKNNEVITANGKFSDQEEVGGEKAGGGKNFAMLCQVIKEANDQSQINNAADVSKEVSSNISTDNDQVKNVVDNVVRQSLKNQVESTKEVRQSRDESEDTIRAYRLSVLRHSSDCKVTSGPCPVFKECGQTKILWRHLTSCKQVNCSVKDCSLSREVLRDYAMQKRSTAGKPPSTKAAPDRVSPIRWQHNTEISKVRPSTAKPSTVQQTRVEPKQTKHDADTSKMHRINLLRHSSECKAEPGKCPLFVECAKARTLWRHMAGCRELSCPVKDCSISREILREYFNSMKEDAKVTTKTTPPSSVGQGASPRKPLPASSPDKVATKTTSPSAVGQVSSPKKPHPASSPPGGTNDLSGNQIKGVRLPNNQLNPSNSQDQSKNSSNVNVTAEKNQHASKNNAIRDIAQKDASPMMNQSEKKRHSYDVVDLTEETATETTASETIAVKPHPVEARATEKEKLSPKKTAKVKKHRLFKNRMKIAVQAETQPVGNQRSAMLSNASRESENFIQPQAVANETKKQRQGVKSKSKKKKTVPSLNSLWDYDFNPSSSSDSEQAYDDVLQADVDVVGDDGKTIYSKIIPCKSRSDDMSLKKTAILGSKISSLNDQIRKADSIIQSTAPSYITYQSKGWVEVASSTNSTSQERRQMIAIPPSEKFYAAPNRAQDFLSLLKSTALKASNNSNEIANAHVMGFLAVIKDIRNNNPPSANPYQLMKRVGKLISSVTSSSFLNDEERELARRKLKRKFDLFLPQGYTMLSENYLWDEKSKQTEKKEDSFVESCARVPHRKPKIVNGSSSSPWKRNLPKKPYMFAVK